MTPTVEARGAAVSPHRTPPHRRFGVVRAGSARVPLSPSVPERRLLESLPSAGAVIDEIVTGVAELGPGGAVRDANPVARTLLDGPAAPRIREMLREMAARVATSEGYAEATVGGPGGDVRLLVARGAGDGAIAFLERDTERAHRTQTQILRTMLATVCEGGSIAAAAGRAMASLAWVMPGTLLVLYEVDPASRTLVALAQARVPPSRAAVLSLQPLDGDFPGARAVRSGAPFRTLTQPLVGAPAAILALPVRVGTQVLGALLAEGSPALLNEAELRLLQGMADAAASLLARERQEATLREERSTRQAAEEQSQRARSVAVQREGFATVGKLTACVTHEMNGPLAFMRTNLKVLGEHAARLEQMAGGAGPVDLSEIARDAHDIVAECLEGLDRIAATVQSLRGLVRDPGTRERFDPAGPLADAVEIFRRSRRDQCQVGLSLSGELPELEGSPTALSHVVLNLLENGLDAMGGSGALQVRAARAGRSLRLEVEDRGPGIAGDIRGRLFEPYFTTKPVGKGTGLGLYICRELVTQMGGRIGFESGASGTVFRVELPGTR